MEIMNRPFTAASYYQFLDEKKIMASRSITSNALYLPPCPICPKSHSNKMEWVQLSGKGKLAAFTVITVGPTFMNNAGFSRDNPYITGIVEMEEGVKISCRILGLNPKKPAEIQIGMPLVADFIKEGNKTALAFKAIVEEKPAVATPEKKAVALGLRMKDKVVLITGGAAGIGKTTAEKFAAEGAKVVICDLNEVQGQEFARTLGNDASFYKVNVADRQAVQNWMDQVVAKYGRIDVLVNNAGIVRDNQLVKMKDGALAKQMPEADFDLVIAVNLKGVFNCTQAAAPYMIKQGSGVILSTSSVVGLDGNFGQTNYVATKAGVVGMTKVWARELGKYNIRVNAVAPGFTATDILSAMPEKVLNDMKSHTPLTRLGQPQDIANAFLFLASDEASFITGTVIRVDGGLVVGT